MNRRVVARVTAALLAVVAALLLAPLALAVADGHAHAAQGYGFTAALVTATALLLRWLGRGETAALHRKDALGVVTLVWLLLGCFGGLPFIIEGSITDPAGAIFEAVSGFTTTGATVVADIDGLSRATSLWRCLMHWVGGMGIVVLFVAVFPQLGVGARQLFKTEVAGPVTEGLKPRITETALTLWIIYSGLTVLCGGLRWWFGMDLYDAACHAMSTLGTGGFSTRSASVGAWPSPEIHWVIALFMLVAGLNFGLFYAAARGRWRDLWENPELRFFILLNLVLVAVTALAISGRHGSAQADIRYAAFQVLSVTTTTGFMTEDFETYPDLVRYLLFLAMFVGGCAGSTAGGLKAIRIYALGKVAQREIATIVQPNAVVAVKVGRTSLSSAVLSGIAVFALAYLGIFALASAVMVALGLDLVTGMSATIACLSSIGPGLEGVGPTQSCAFVPAVGKLVLSGCMLLGRLEIFVLLAAFTPEAWRR